MPYLSLGSSLILVPFLTLGIPNFKKLDFQIKNTPKSLLINILEVISKWCLLSSGLKQQKIVDIKPGLDGTIVNS